jgi:hypothetical protein
MALSQVHPLINTFCPNPASTTLHRPLLIGVCCAALLEYEKKTRGTVSVVGEWVRFQDLVRLGRDDPALVWHGDVVIALRLHDGRTVRLDL